MTTTRIEGSTGSEEDGFWVRFWGVRGTMPCTDPELAGYGGNTPCLEINCGGRTLMFDGGSGATALGNKLVDKGVVDLDIFLTHAHFDHVQGLPFFWPFFQKDTRVRFWSGDLEGKQSSELLMRDLMKKPFLPITPDIFNADIDYRDFATGDTLTLSQEIVIRTTALNHPGGCVGYRIDYAGGSICYISDTEHVSGEIDGNIMALVQDADIMIYDATYTEEEYKPCRGYGHSTWQEGVKLCEAAGVGQFVTFHHHTGHNDRFLDALAEDLDRHRPGSLVSKEGMILSP